MTVYNQIAALAGRNDTLFDNEETLDSNYNGGDITVNKRMSNGWSLMARRQLRQEHRRRPWRRPEQSELEGIPQGTARQRRAVVVSSVRRLRPAVQHRVAERHDAVLQRCAGVDDGADRRRRSARRSDAGDRSRWSCSRAATVRLPNVFSLDMSLRKTFRMGNMSFEPRLDFYNLTNEATITNWLTQLGSTYHRASTIQAGRMIKLGLQFRILIRKNEERKTSREAGPALLQTRPAFTFYFLLSTFSFSPKVTTYPSGSSNANLLKKALLLCSAIVDFHLRPSNRRSVAWQPADTAHRGQRAAVRFACDMADTPLRSGARCVEEDFHRSRLHRSQRQTGMRLRERCLSSAKPSTSQ